MWNIAAANCLIMTAGDYGVALPVVVSGTTLTSADTLRFTYKKQSGQVVLVKELTNISGNTANLELSEAESALFAPGSFVYSLDWYQDGAFMCNLIQQAIFRVEAKA